MPDKGTATLKLTYRMENGAPGKDDDPKNPISRALTSMMKDSSLLPTFTLAFLVDDTAGEPWRWLGVFVKSAGDRILFFPGFKEQIIRVRGSSGENLQFDRPFRLDHVSIEKHRGSWHITTAKSKDHQGGPEATDLGDGRVLWFGLSLASTEVLRELRKDTVATFEVPDRTAKWKADQFKKSREGKEFPGVYLPSRPNPARGPIFPLVSVVVGPTGFQTYLGPHWGWPYGSEFMRGEPSGDWTIPSRHQRFHLDDKTDIQITTIWAPGALTIQAVMSAPTNP
jgi:hypothetical protein